MCIYIIYYIPYIIYQTYGRRLRSKHEPWYECFSFMLNVLPWDFEGFVDTILYHFWLAYVTKTNILTLSGERMVFVYPWVDTPQCRSFGLVRQATTWALFEAHLGWWLVRGLEYLLYIWGLSDSMKECYTNMYQHILTYTIIYYHILTYTNIY